MSSSLIVVNIVLLLMYTNPALLLAAEDCTKTLTIAPGNITQFTTIAPLSPLTTDSATFCDYFIRAPSSKYFIELNLTELHQLGSNTRPTSSLHGKIAEPPSGHHRGNEPKQSKSTWSTGNNEGRRHLCLPSIILVEVTRSGQELGRHQLCLHVDAVVVPTVLRTKSHMLKLHYSWDPQQTVSFSLSFVFHKWPSVPCSGAFTCDDGHCLFDNNLICNNFADCPDRSDERNCYHPTLVGHQFMQTVLIVIVVVIVLGVVVCVVIHWRFVSGVLRQRLTETSSSGIRSEHHHLNSHDLDHHSHTTNTEILYVQGQSLDAMIQRERQIRTHQIQTDTQLNLPPAIPISEDGEEGFLRSQQSLQLSCHNPKCRQSVLPPPNKTVYPGDSPPPYRHPSQYMNHGNSHHSNNGDMTRCHFIPSDRSSFLPHTCFHGIPPHNPSSTRTVQSSSSVHSVQLPSVHSVQSSHVQRGVSNNTVAPGTHLVTKTKYNNCHRGATSTRLSEQDTGCEYYGSPPPTFTQVALPTNATLNQS